MNTEDPRRRRVPAQTEPGGMGDRIRADVEALESRVLPGWLRPGLAENRIPLIAAIVAAVALQLAIPAKYGLHPRWLLPSLELVLLAALTAINPVRLTRSTTAGRYASIALVVAITVDNAFSAGLLDYDILTSKASSDAVKLFASGIAIYLTNIVAFGIWYWELDRGGPFARRAGRNPYPAFLFPQMANPDLAPPHWAPQFLDYLYVSLTNVVAFSPTDTLPLSRWAKSLMAGQSIISVTTTALVIARAVNVLH